MIRVAEVDVAHVVGVVKKIGVEGVVVPEVVLIIFSFQVAIDHEVQEAGHACTNVSPKDWAQHIEPRVGRTHDFVVRVSREALVGCHVGECFLERNDSMLHKGKRTEPKDSNTGTSVRSPVSVEVHLNILMEDTVATFNRLPVYTFTEIAHLLWVVLNLIFWLPSIRLVEREEALGSARHILIIL